jgi:hypothetical protein
MQEHNRSTGWVAIALALCVAYFGWALLAADYAPPVAPKIRRGRINWLGNAIRLVVHSVVQLPHFPSVMRHAFQTRHWGLVVTVILEAGVFVLWIVTRKLDRELWSQ